MDLLSIPSWRAIAVRGALALLFALCTALWPTVSLTTLVLLFGIYALLDGIVAILVGSRVHPNDRSWLHPFEGLLGIALGIVMILWTGASAAVMAPLIGGWALFTGALEFMAAQRLRREIPGEAFLAFSGAASVVLGLMLMLFPSRGSLVLVILLGSYGLVFGVATLLLAMRLRHGERRRRAGSLSH